MGGHLFGLTERLGQQTSNWIQFALATPVVLRYGRLATMDAHRHAKERGEKPPNMTGTPFPVMVGKGVLHCGSGCMLGNVAAEWLAFLVPAVAVWFGWRSLFEEKMYAVWVLDFVFAYALGIGFKYYAIVQMWGLSPGKGLVAALKADALSLIAWQVGMYGLMALVQFGRHPRLGSQRAGEFGRVLFRHAGRHGHGFPDQLPGELLAYRIRHQGADVGRP